MTPVHRALASDLIAFSLSDEIRIIRDELHGAHARIARTLVKEGPLRLTLVGMKPGGSLRPHEAAGPITIHVLEGEIALDAAGTTRTLSVGMLVALDGGVRHALHSQNGGMFLLTVATRSSATERSLPSPETQDA